MNNPAPPTLQTVEALWKVQKLVLDTLDFRQVVQKIVDSIAFELDYLKLGYRIVVLSLADEQAGVLRRVSMSQTTAAEATMGAGKISFDQIVIPLSATNNICIQTYHDQQIRTTSDWKDILTPPMEIEEARRLQQISEVKNSIVYPIIERSKCIGVLIFSLSKDTSEMSTEEKNLIQGFTEIVGLAIHDSRLYTNLENTTFELQKANEKLQELDKMKDEFLSLASHELRTPMTAIKGYVWMIQNNKAGPITDTTKNYLDIVYKSTERLIHLVNDMLDISRIESGKTQLHPEISNISDIFSQVKNEFAAQALTKNMDITTNPGDSIPQLNIDKDKITQVLENLVGNSIKYTPDGGKITITATNKDDHIEISVTDTGKGMAEEDLPKLFTKFTRLGGENLTTFSQPGTGLGLYLSKQYVEMHHGQIWATSTLGQGSTFTFSLPIANITT